MSIYEQQNRQNERGFAPEWRFAIPSKSMKNSMVAISTGPTTHLDHLAPLCWLLDIALIVTEPDHEVLAKRFYPMVEIQYIPLAELSVYKLATFDPIITCGNFWAMDLRPLLQMVTQKTVRFIFSPHGYSDKEELLTAPAPSQDIQLVYGQTEMRRGAAIEIGNIRHRFYKRYKAHFDQLAAPFFKTTKKTVLYAPTWESPTAPTSFFDQMGRVVDALADSYHLLVKPHPLLEDRNPALYYRILGQYEDRVTFIEEFPPIYPLLDKTDIYLGDFSSIGYDFLVYNRPLFFLGSKGALTACGRPFTGSVESMQTELARAREETVRRIFKTPAIEATALKRAIANQLGERTVTSPSSSSEGARESASSR